MGLDINLLAIDYPKVSTDKGRFTDVISAILAKALSCAKIYCDSDHTVKYNVEKAMRAGSGFSRLHRPYNKLQGLNIYYSYPVLISTEACFLLCLKITLQMYKEYFRFAIYNKCWTAETSGTLNFCKKGSFICNLYICRTCETAYLYIA